MGLILRKRLIKVGVPYKCYDSECPNPQPMWKGKPLTLQVDHIDGDKFNNTFDNLRFICPNCHSQTDTFGRRNVSPQSRYDICECGRTKSTTIEKCKFCTVEKLPPRIIDPAALICGCGNKKESTAKQCLTCDKVMRKNNQSARYPEKDELVEKLIATSFVSVAKEVGVSDIAVRKYLRSLDVDPGSILQMRKARKVTRV